MRNRDVIKFFEILIAFIFFLILLIGRYLFPLT